MTGDVLICHAADDTQVARSLRDALRRASFGSSCRCAGSADGGSDPLKEAEAVVVLYSRPAVTDLQLAWEIGQAARFARPLIVFRCDDTPLLGVLEPLLDRAPALTASGDLASDADRLVALVRDRLPPHRVGKNGTAPTVSAAKDRPVRPGRGGLRFAEPLAVVGPHAESSSGSVVASRPPTLKGWAVSVGLHAAVLGLLALGVLNARPRDDRRFEAAFVAREPGGDLAGWSGSIAGLDRPEPDTRLHDEAPILTAIPVPEFRFESELARRPDPPKGPATAPGIARAGEGFGTANFGPGTESIRGVKVHTGDPQFTLLWDTRVDLDLHVSEPGGEHLFWLVKGKKSRLGGMLDVDNVTGFGPENVFWEHGQGPPGEYRWYVEYFGAFGGLDVPTRWQVRIKQDGQERVIDGRFRKNGEKSRTYTVRIPARPAASAAGRPESGRD